MIWNCLVLLSCLAVSLGEEYPSYYVPESHHPQVVSGHYADGANHGHHGAREYDHGGQRHLENIHDAHGSRQYGEGDNHALRDIAQQAHHNQGAHEAVHSSGGQENHVRKAHDRGFYEREKKYGYEKAYGYERETKHHDKADTAQSHGSGYNHNANRGHYNQGGQAIKDLATHGHRHKYGSEAHGDKNILIDLTADHNRGRDVASHYNNQHNFRNINHITRHAPHRTYMPLFLKQGYNDVDGSLARFRYLSGIHGLGGHRGYGLGYGYNPLRYGYSPVPQNRNINHELVYVRQPVVQAEPISNAYYIRH